ncbi:hypothetical protein ACN23B_27315 (plasmid) [Anabaena sp. FACHB-709]|uniref:Transposase n=1 Tax=Anabaena cylindrica FACHB-318 TaxID=2692880 RepID=A0ABR7ZQM0_ANACY|nr:hypothetical protein [Anabaena cylindrica]MBD2174959.1 hypothetical protein [Anabaena cylindrica FACHB-318]MBD2286912.1 hypothetical protein [Anabaena cylindrica FACHB-170]
MTWCNPYSLVVHGDGYARRRHRYLQNYCSKALYWNELRPFIPIGRKISISPRIW